MEKFYPLTPQDIGRIYQAGYRQGVDSGQGLEDDFFRSLAEVMIWGVSGKSPLLRKTSVDARLREWGEIEDELKKDWLNG